MTNPQGRTAFSDPLFRDSLTDALGASTPHTALTSGSAGAQDIVPQHWSLAAELGWTAVLVGEESGGLGLDLCHVADACEAMGRSLFCGPYVETAAFLPAFVSQAGGEAVDLLPAVATGEVRLAVADIDAGAAKPEDGFAWSPVEHAVGATHVLFLRETGDGADYWLAGPGSFEVDPLQPLDVTATLGRVRLSGTRKPVSGNLSAAEWEAALVAMHLGLAAELLGIGEAVLERTVEHVRTREQFGQPIGRFQVIKHRLADAETMLSSARLAIAQSASAPDSFTDAVTARVLAARAARGITADAIQFHGGIGFSWETDLHLYLKRALRLSARNGGTSALQRLAGDRFIAGIAARENQAA